MIQKVPDGAPTKCSKETAVPSLVSGTNNIHLVEE